MCDTVNTCIAYFVLHPGDDVATSIRLERDIEQRLDNLAAQTGRTKSYYLRELIHAGLDALEAQYLVAAGQERMRKVELAGSAAEQLRRKLGLGG